MSPLRQSREDRPPRSPSPLTQSHVSRQVDLENAQTTVTVESTFSPNIASQCTTVAVNDNAVQQYLPRGYLDFTIRGQTRAEGEFDSFLGAAPRRGSGALPTGRAPASAPLVICPYRKVTGGRGGQTSFTRPRRPVHSGCQYRSNTSSKSRC